MSDTPTSAPVRHFGPFELRRLLGKSAATMVWLAFDPRAGSEVMLTMPRVQPTGAALERWQRTIRAAARLDHPQIAPVLEVGLQDHWPYLVVERRHGSTLPEWLASHPKPKPAEVVAWLAAWSRGLAFAHEAGVVHRDLQLHHLLIDDRGGVRLMGLAAAAPDTAETATDDLRAQRDAAVRDLTACGVLLHALLGGQPVLGQADVALVLERMAPAGREVVRLPWTTPWPVPEALRAIANRCTSGQPRLRYQSARTLIGALTGWLDAQAEDGGGPLGLLVDRLRTVGHLPALPGLARRAADLAARDTQRTEEIADLVLEDLALSFELLRTLNTAQVQGTQVQGNGAVLTLRRVVALIGVEGVRRAAQALRSWPGPLNERQAEALKATLERIAFAGRVAQRLRPAGYDAQVVYLITALQNLGRLMLRYHFADEAEQVEQLTRPARAADLPGQAEQPGLDEEAAAWAVLGVDVESLGATVARQWGLGDDVMQMARRVPPEAPIHRPDTDNEMLRLTASAANDLVDASERQAVGPRAAAELGRVAQRYARALGLTIRDFAEALAAARVSGQEPDDPAPSKSRLGRDAGETGVVESTSSKEQPVGVS